LRFVALSLTLFHGERVRERVSKPQACLFGKRYNPVHPINPYPKASSCRIKPSDE